PNRMPRRAAAARPRPRAWPRGRVAAAVRASARRASDGESPPIPQMLQSDPEVDKGPIPYGGIAFRAGLLTTLSDIGAECFALSGRCGREMVKCARPDRIAAARVAVALEDADRPP